MPDIGGGFEEYFVAYCLILGVGLRNILLPDVVVVVVGLWVLLDVNVDKDRRGGGIQGGGKRRGCIRINLILLILYNYLLSLFSRLRTHD